MACSSLKGEFLLMSINNILILAFLDHYKIWLFLRVWVSEESISLSDPINMFLISVVQDKVQSQNVQGKATVSDSKEKPF